MNDDNLKLKNQLCFPLYAAAKEVVRQYKPLLDRLGLTYTQYITLMVLWEHESINVKTLGQYLYLDSGTLTPLLKRLEQSGYLLRVRSKDDERNVMITLTDAGKNLKKEALSIPEQIVRCLPLSPEEAKTLYQLLYKILDSENCAIKKTDA
ncbi:MarR family transcriptional regulator [Eubacteriaceae bacterium ES2]|nr:MarR family transcriptional regulator [Eubacteriaceae bacterium ES2]